MNKYEVTIVFKGQINYIVEASSEEEAKELGQEKYYNGEPATIFGNEWQSCENVIVEKLEAGRLKIDKSRKQWYDTLKKEESK